MKQRHFKRTLTVLTGLTGYFLTLSAILIAFAGIPGDQGFIANGDRMRHGRGNTFGKQTASFRSGPAPHDHKSRFAAANPQDKQYNPCAVFPSECGSHEFEQEPDASLDKHGRAPSEPAFANNTDSAIGGTNQIPPNAFAFSGAGGSGLGGSAGANNGAAGNTSSMDRSEAIGVTPPGPTDPSQRASSPIQSYNDLPGIFPELVDDPPQYKYVAPVAGNLPPGDPTAPQPVPEPSTLWLLLGSLAALITARRSSVRGDAHNRQQ